MKISRFCEGTAVFYIRTFLVGALEYIPKSIRIQTEKENPA